MSKIIFLGAIIFLTGCAAERYHKELPPSVSLPMAGQTDPVPFIWPVLPDGSVLPYGSQEEGVSIKGMVIYARENEVVRAAKSGKVVLIDEKLKGYGKIIILEHSENFSTVYARNSEILVRAGQEVRQGDPIGRVGLAGKGDKPQLYFEIRRNSKAEDPAAFLPKNNF